MAAARRALRVSRAAEPLDDHGKDERLGELLQLAAMQGHGDLDLERASRALEAVSWDVSEAFERLCTGRRAVPVDRPRGGGRLADHDADMIDAELEMLQRMQRRGGGADGSDGSDDAAELEMLQRMQQQEYDRAFAEEARSLRHARRAHRQRAAEVPTWVVAEDLPEAQDANEVNSLSEEGDAVPQGPPRFVRDANERHRRMNGRDFARALAQTGRDEVFAPFGLNGEDDDEEAMGMHALLSMLIRSQDEADLQDAMRRSSEEAYSGSFSVPPVDEAVLQAVTKTSQHQSCDAKGQCSVCLMDFEHGDSLRTLQCCHSFHMACVDQWLAQSGSCPVCKKTVGGIER